jgi:hypothetical protein
MRSRDCDSAEGGHEWSGCDRWQQLPSVPLRAIYRKQQNDRRRALRGPRQYAILYEDRRALCLAHRQKRREVLATFSWVGGEMATRRALIIGGSVGGLFAAHMLERIGWEVDVFERASEELAGRGAGIGTHPALHEVMRRLGLAFDDTLSVATGLLG